MKQDPAQVERSLGLMFIAKHLERIADHATNISEMVVYLVRGTDVRHRFSVEERAHRHE
jgi:phosphate transport system protein